MAASANATDSSHYRFTGTADVSILDMKHIAKQALGDWYGTRIQYEYGVSPEDPEPSVGLICTRIGQEPAFIARERADGSLEYAANFSPSRRYDAIRLDNALKDL